MDFEKRFYKHRNPIRLENFPPMDLFKLLEEYINAYSVLDKDMNYRIYNVDVFVNGERYSMSEIPDIPFDFYLYPRYSSATVVADTDIADLSVSLYSYFLPEKDNPFNVIYVNSFLPDVDNRDNVDLFKDFFTYLKENVNFNLIQVDVFYEYSYADFFNALGFYYVFSPESEDNYFIELAKATDIYVDDIFYLRKSMERDYLQRRFLFDFRYHRLPIDIKRAIEYMVYVKDNKLLNRVIDFLSEGDENDLL